MLSKIFIKHKQALGCKVSRSGFGVSRLGFQSFVDRISGSGFRGPAFRVFRVGVSNWRFGVSGSVFRIGGSGFSICGLGFSGFRD